MERLFKRARLTRVQAEVATLAGREYTYSDIARRLKLPYPAVRNAARTAEEKLKEAHPWLLGRMRRQIAAMLACLRNVRDTNACRVLVYRERSFGYEKEPVTLRPRPEGEVPEDLMDEPGRLLRSLPALLAIREEQSAVEDGR